MSVLIQYDFFKSREISEKEALSEEIAKLRESNDRVRKALFARHGDLAKRLMELEERQRIIEEGLCYQKMK